MAFRYRKTLYKFNVLECIDADGKSQEAVCVQVRKCAGGRTLSQLWRSTAVVHVIVAIPSI